jgi:hypothetical protein
MQWRRSLWSPQGWSRGTGSVSSGEGVEGFIWVPVDFVEWLLSHQISPASHSQNKVWPKPHIGCLGLPYTIFAFSTYPLYYFFLIFFNTGDLNSGPQA